MKGLPIPVRRVLVDASDDLTVERVWRRIAATRNADRYKAGPVPLAGRRWMVAASAATAAAAVVVAWGLAHRPMLRDAGPLRLASGQDIGTLSAPAGAASADVVALSDGSQLVLQPDTQLEVLENSGHGFDLILLRGRATFDVRPGGPRRWSIEAGIASVEVVGTRFTVARDTSRVHVDVERGIVIVRSDRIAEHVRRLVASEFVDIDAVPTTSARETRAPAAEPPVRSKAPIRRTVARREPEAPATAPTPLPVPPEPAKPAQPPAASWKTLAQDGNYAEAYHTLGSNGVVAEVSRAPSAEDLFALADIARYSGHPASAVSPLEQIIAQHRSEPAAALAAFTLGKIELDSLNDPDKAAQAFAQAIQLGPPPGILESTYERLVEARSRAGDRAGARAAAAEYVRKFPQGQYRSEMDSWLSNR